MILVPDDEVQPDYRYLGPEIAHFLPESEYQVYVNDKISQDLILVLASSSVVAPPVCTE